MGRVKKQKEDNMEIRAYRNRCNKCGYGYRGVSRAASAIGKSRATVLGYLDGSRPSRVVEGLFRKHRITVVRT